MPHVVHVGAGVTGFYLFFKHVFPLLVPAGAGLGCWSLTVLAIVTYVFSRKLRALLGGQLPIEGSVVITGCDSGIGKHAAKLLAKKGFHVYAGILRKENASLYEEFSSEQLTPLVMDITSDDSVDAAVKQVRQGLKKRNDKAGLVGIINVAGLGFIGPAEFFPVAFYQKQIEVNLVGPYRVTQRFLPLLREAVCKPEARRRGRVLLFGTGGGVPSPAPPMLTAYMGSKWGNEALCHGLRVEMQLTEKPIDVAMINPGFVKPTALAPVGKKLLADTYKEMGPEAVKEYKPLIDKFVAFSEEQPGTHPDVVAGAVLEAMNAKSPKIRYKVGFDSHVSPLVGLLPTSWREWLLKKSMYAK